LKKRSGSFRTSGSVQISWWGEKEFANTFALANSLPFAYFHVFNFSRRPGTAAARMTDTVRPATAKARSRSLAELSRAKRVAFYQRYLDQTLPVLFETRDATGLWIGLTGNYVRVGVATRSDLSNRICEVVLTGVMDGLAVGHLAETGR